MSLRGPTGRKSTIAYISTYLLAGRHAWFSGNEVDSLLSNAHYPPHAHAGLTTHLILSGELTITYPDDANPSKETFGPGSRLDVDAKRRHEVFVGSAGCTYVIGE